ncbi:4Fe-4S dicluster domain-containing protein [Myxococcota bacterium]|nr:4Fe-4S dicluster domain-containing protein [Myxococcota bacterium]
MAVHLPSPREDLYWDRDALTAEEKRVFEICNGCRLCFNLCPSFPALFQAVDALDVDAGPADPARSIAVDAHGNHAAMAEDAHAATPRQDVMGQLEALQKLPLSVHERVVDLCYQCKLCDPICPYTPPHEFAVDFPRLMLRHKAVDARQHGVPLQDRVLGNPDLVGRLGTTLPLVANAGAAVRLNRVMMEATVGIHRDRQLPRFASQTFQEWYGPGHRKLPPPDQVSGRKVVLFYTCSVQWNEPQVGRAAVEVLEHSGVTVYAPELKCCGMPALDGGDVPRATAWAAHNVQVLLPFVQAGCQVVCPGPTCSYMLKHEWKEYLGTEQAQQVAAASFDLMEYLHGMRKEGALVEDYVQEVGEIGYHVPCHLKIQKIGFRSRDVLKKLPGAKVKLVDKCSCMDGTWGMKKEYYDLSKQWAKPMLEQMPQDAAATLSSDCLIAKLQIEEGTGKPVQHPIEIVWKALGGEALAGRTAAAGPAPAKETE